METTNVLEAANVVKTLTDQAAVQSDRWLFLATLIIFAGVLIWLARHLIAKIEVTENRHQADREAAKSEIKQDRDRYQASIESIVKEQHATAIQLAVILNNNTEALKLCTEQLKDMREDARRLA